MIKSAPTASLNEPSSALIDNLSPQEKWEMLLVNAKRGNLPTVKYLLENYETEIDAYLYQTYENEEEEYLLGNEEEIASIAISKVFVIATKKLHLELLRWVFSEMTPDTGEKFDQFDSKMIKACVQGKEDIVAFYLMQNKLEISSKSIMEALSAAAENGHLQLVTRIFTLSSDKIDYTKIEPLLWHILAASTYKEARKRFALEQGNVRLAQEYEIATDKLICVACYLFTQIHETVDLKPLLVCAANKRALALVRIIFELSSDKLDIQTLDKAITNTKADDTKMRLFLFRKRAAMGQAPSEKEQAEPEMEQTTFTPPIPWPTDSSSIAEEIWSQSLTLHFQFRALESCVGRNPDATIRVLQALSGMNSIVKDDSASSSDSDLTDEEREEFSSSSSDSDEDDETIADNSLNENFANLSLKPGRGK